MEIWFTSDTHFNHANIIKYCNRPFSSVGEMNETLIAKWNERVKPNDTLYHIGDVCMGSVDDAPAVLERLNGQKFLVAGNHDKRMRKHESFAKHFEWIKDYFELEIKGEGLLISMHHYARLTWNRSHRGAWALSGHSHGTLPEILPSTLDKGKQLDVGSDIHNYAPISYSEVKEIMSHKEFIPVDHHNGDI